MAMSVEELVENFELFDEWEDRYAYIIDLGKKLPPLPEEDRIDANKVRGCQSQVWLTSNIDRSGQEPVLTFNADSDAFIVKGLIAILLNLYNGQLASYVKNTDALAVMERIGLQQHLSPNRRNGFVSMVEKIQSIAEHA